MYQSLTLAGNVGGDPEIRYTPSGDTVCNFRVAVNRKWTTKDGERQEKTTWFRVTAWRKLAEIVAEHLKKGHGVLVVGELEQPRVWENNDGEHKAALEVTAQTVRFLGGRGDESDKEIPF